MRAYLISSVAAVLFAGSAWAHDGAQTCDSVAAKQPAIENARSELKKKPKSVSLRTNLADMLIGISCYDEAVHVLEDGAKLFPNDRNLQTRLRTAHSFIGEREYLEKQVVGTGPVTNAAFARLQLRCQQVGDMEACDQALAARPNDAALWVAKGDVLLKEKRPRDALQVFGRTQQAGQGADIDLTSRISTAQAMLAAQSPPSIATSAPATQPAQRTASAVPGAPKFSNAAPASRSN